MKSAVIIIVLVLLVTGGFFIYKNQQKSQQATVTPQPSAAMIPDKMEASPMVSEGAMSPEPSGAMMKAAGAVKEFTVEGKNFSFTPGTMTVNKGDTVKVTFKNTSGIHDLRIDEFNVATKQIQGGAEETVSFTADKTGTYEYYCSVGNHRAMGMKGTLTVK